MKNSIPSSVKTGDSVPLESKVMTGKILNKNPDELTELFQNRLKELMSLANHFKFNAFHRFFMSFCQVEMTKIAEILHQVHISERFKFVDLPNKLRGEKSFIH